MKLANFLVELGVDDVDDVPEEKQMLRVVVESPFGDSFQVNSVRFDYENGTATIETEEITELRLHDEDTDESLMDVVKVPEGFSIQMSMKHGQPMPQDYISVIVRPENARALADFLMRND
jgi:hypothetical protein